MFKWLANICNSFLKPKPHIWQCDTHGSWVRIFENNEMIYAGNIVDMPLAIKRKYDGYMSAVRKMEDEIERLYKEFEKYVQVREMRDRQQRRDRRR